MSEALFGSELDAMVTRYLEELNEVLRRLPASQRDHLVSEIREHIVEMRAERPVRDRSDMEALLNRVGLPEDIAAVALEGEDEFEEITESVATAPAPMAPPAPRYFGGRLSRRSLMAGTAAGAILLFGLFVGFAVRSHAGPNSSFAFIRQGSSAQPVLVRPDIGQAVPDVIGQSQGQAEATLTVVGLAYAVATAPSATVPAGQVMGQSPPSGTYVLRRVTITITVSSGPAATTS